jgi:hypothetical protein
MATFPTAMSPDAFVPGTYGPDTPVAPLGESARSGNP